jgi:hypothetical protein
MAVATGHESTSRKATGEHRSGAAASLLRGDPRWQAYALMRLAFIAAPIAFGLDKFFGVMVDWPIYLAPWIDDIVPGSAQDFMYVVGVVEIAAGLLVAVRPRLGAYVVAAWLGGIIFNLVTGHGYYDIALRDFGLLLGALSLARLAAVYDAPGHAVSASARSASPAIASPNEAR